MIYKKLLYLYTVEIIFDNDIFATFINKYVIKRISIRYKSRTFSR